MAVGIHVTTYLETYAQRLFDLRKGEFRGMTNERLLCAVGEALEMFAPTEEEIRDVTAHIRKLLRDESLPPHLLARPTVDDGLFR